MADSDAQLFIPPTLQSSPQLPGSTAELFGVFTPTTTYYYCRADSTSGHTTVVADIPPGASVERIVTS